jgi:hypothetical protein
MNENKQSGKSAQLKAELKGGCLLVYREAPAREGEERGEITDLYSVFLGALKPNRKNLLQYNLKEEEDAQVLLFQKMDELQCRGLQVTGQLMELRVQKQEYEEKLEGVRNVRALGPELEESFHGARQQKKLERKMRELEEQEQELLSLHNQETTGLKPLEEEVSTMGLGILTEEPMHVAVFSMGGQLFVVYGPISSVYNNMLKCHVKVKNVGLDGSKLWVDVWARFENIYNLEIGECRVNVGELFSQAQSPVVLDKMIDDEVDKSKYLLHFTVPTHAIADYSKGEESPVKLEGNPINLTMVINGVVVPYRLRKKATRHVSMGGKHSKREAWVPTYSVFCDGYALHIRRNFSGTYVVVKREMYPVEHELGFRIKESKLVSFLMFQLGRVVNHIPGRKKVAIFFEKRGEKAEEGTFELCKACSDSKRTRCYYVIDEHSEDYERIKGDPCVVKKFSWKYYWLLYCVNYFIAAEAPIHLNLLNSNNRYVRWSMIRHPFIFLQHGITYLKRQGDRSTYIKGKAGQCSYIIVSSEKEKAVVAETFRIAPSRVWITGMLMFDNCAYKHMNQDSPDKITVMLTWKPYEETLDNFEDSTYFKYTLQVYEMLQKYVPRENINIVAHPRAHDLLMSTSLHDLVWDKPISEVLKESKLLITDYSSVCWNSFYQGGGVVFYQPDLEEYEAYVGKLIPEDNEYIGHRAFDEVELEKILSTGLKSGSVDLSYFRNQEFEELYNSINSFHDGKNTQRVKEALKKNRFI